MSNPLPLVVLPLAIHAQDALDPLILTASRTEIPESESPYWVDAIDQTYIQQNSRRTLPEALQFIPGVLVQKTGYGHGSPYIRGFTGRQNLLMVEGIRINNSTWRSGPVQYWNTIDPYSIDRFELVKSQGSVLYGSDAVGGTLNVFTKSSNFLDQPEGEFFANGSAYYEYRSNGDGSHIGRIEQGHLTLVPIGNQCLQRKGIAAVEELRVGLRANSVRACARPTNSKSQLVP